MLNSWNIGWNRLGGGIQYLLPTMIEPHSRPAISDSFESSSRKLTSLYRNLETSLKHSATYHHATNHQPPATSSTSCIPAPHQPINTVTSRNL